MHSTMRSALVLLGLVQMSRACGVCHAVGPAGAPAMVLTTTPAGRRSIGRFGVVVASQWMRRRPVAVLGAALVHRVLSDVVLSREDAPGEEAAPGAEDAESSAPPKGTDEPMSGAMIATIGVYKNFISPLLPPACRFLPTCSQYGVQAIQEFGPCRGAVLTAWRLLRCSPAGGRGYDPPRWPPVPYGYSSY